MNDKYIYPAIFEYEENNSISVYFPDLEGCFSYGETEKEAFEMAQEALSLHLYGLEEDNVTFPMASTIKGLKTENNQSVVLIDTWLVPIREKNKNKKIKKTLTIKNWINELAIKNDINFSEFLENSIIEKFNIKNIKS